MPTFSRVAPSVFVTDLNRAQRFFVDVLGFSFECVDEPPVRAVVTQKNAVLHLDLRPQKAGTCVIHMLVDDLDSVVERLRAANVKLLKPPTVQVWGLRDISVADPDGNVFEIAEPVRSAATR